MSIPRHIGPGTRAFIGLSGLAMVFGLAGCGEGPATKAPSPSDATPAVSAASTGGDDPQESPDAVNGNFVVLPGTGRYAIGIAAPYGGYQLHGEPDEQPAGCTWSIEDADGVAVFHDQGQYAFLTDIKEAVTFVTDGCPDWEQFQ